MRRSLIAVASLIVGIAGMGLATAPAAGAAGYGCGGSLIDQYNIKDSAGSTWGTINLYYSTANGGTNCAVNVTKKYVGTPHHMEVHLFQGSRVKNDSGTYSQYAGPVSLTGTDGDCISVSGEVDDPAGNSVAAGWSDVHCG
ncbi:hypothetical protein ACFVXE_06175 [Streptomyces sp. NPDC058231]|uniref:hypothetical protein n=1 Tax=Streptomyces sp. NPDC058231 TaxID=3346392 RepID=UPI0036E6EC25